MGRGGKNGQESPDKLAVAIWHLTGNEDLAKAQRGKDLTQKRRGTESQGKVSTQRREGERSY